MFVARRLASPRKRVEDLLPESSLQLESGKAGHSFGTLPQREVRRSAAESEAAWSLAASEGMSNLGKGGEELEAVLDRTSGKVETFDKKYARVDGEVRPASAQPSAIEVPSEFSAVRNASRRRDRLLELCTRELRKDYDKYPEGYLPRARPITSTSRRKGAPNSFGIPVVDLDALGPAHGGAHGNKRTEKYLLAGEHRTVRPRQLTIDKTWQPQLHAELNMWASGVGIFRK